MPLYDQATHHQQVPHLLLLGHRTTASLWDHRETMKAHRNEDSMHVGPTTP